MGGLVPPAEDLLERELPGFEPFKVPRSDPVADLASSGAFERRSLGTKCLLNILAFSSSGRSSKSNTGGVSEPVARGWRDAERPPTAWGAGRRGGESE